MSHLTEQDRCMIENLLNAGLSPLAIAHKLNRAHSTIEREIRKHRAENEDDLKRKKNFCSRRKSCSNPIFAIFHLEIVPNDAVNAR